MNKTVKNGDMNKIIKNGGINKIIKNTDMFLKLET